MLLRRTTTTSRNLESVGERSLTRHVLPASCNSLVRLEARSGYSRSTEAGLCDATCQTNGAAGYEVLSTYSWSACPFSSSGWLAGRVHAAKKVPKQRSGTVCTCLPSYSVGSTTWVRVDGETGSKTGRDRETEDGHCKQRVETRSLSLSPSEQASAEIQ